MCSIESLDALEILDSRGRPTLKAWCRLTDGHQGAASVPSGASTGTSEAIEARDGDGTRFRGFGCQRAVQNVRETLNRALQGKRFDSQEALDRALLEVDGTPNKARLGANSLLSVSLAFARAQAAQRGWPLFRHLSDLARRPLERLPRPEINLFSGGKHAGAQAPLQDVLVVPMAAKSMGEALAVTFEIYQCAAEWSARQYGMRLLRADEGGLAPPFPSAETMLADGVKAIETARLRPGEDVALAIDAAATHFYEGGRYHLDQRLLTSDEMIQQLRDWATRFPIFSVEDGLAEDDWDNWPQLRAQLAGRCRVVGDDLLCTNPARIRRAIERQAADTLLLKVNQIGTLTEALEAYQLGRGAGWQVIVSARSGETEDDWLADLAVGLGADQIKIGSITQSERLSKYNRLLEIERETGLTLIP